MTVFSKEEFEKEVERILRETGFVAKAEITASYPSDTICETEVKVSVVYNGYIKGMTTYAFGDLIEGEEKASS